jgi:molybdopterin-guanine dinucleotide biosynthesis protein B
LVVKLIRLLGRRGLRVGTVKDYRGPQPFDTPGKDTDRHRKAGAEIAVLRSPREAKMFFSVPVGDTLVGFVERHLSQVDLVLVEGFKAEAVPKIEVARSALAREIVLQGDPNLCAVFADFDPGAGVPLFGPGEEERLADFIVEHVFTEKGGGRV